MRKLGLTAISTIILVQLSACGGTILGTPQKGGTELPTRPISLSFASFPNSEVTETVVCVGSAKLYGTNVLSEPVEEIIDLGSQLFDLPKNEALEIIEDYETRISTLERAELISGDCEDGLTARITNSLGSTETDEALTAVFVPGDDPIENHAFFKYKQAALERAHGDSIVPALNNVEHELSKANTQSENAGNAHGQSGPVGNAGPGGGGGFAL